MVPAVLCQPSLSLLWQVSSCQNVLISCDWPLGLSEKEVPLGLGDSSVENVLAVHLNGQLPRESQMDMMTHLWS